MRVHCLQHSDRVRPLGVERWASSRDVDLHVVRVWEAPLPDANDVDRLVVLGGEMNTDEAVQHPWLDAERAFLAQVLARTSSRVFGICLGSQLLAEVLGGTVGRAAQREVGWHELSVTEAGRRSPVFGCLPERFEAFEWHGDSWSLPSDAFQAVTGTTCDTQAFEWDARVFAVQFHPEFTYERTRELAATTTDDLAVGGAVQRPEEFLDRPERFDALGALLDRMLDAALLERTA